MEILFECFLFNFIVWTLSFLFFKKINNNCLFLKQKCVLHFSRGSYFVHYFFHYDDNHGDCWLDSFFNTITLYSSMESKEQRKDNKEEKNVLFAWKMIMIIIIIAINKKVWIIIICLLYLINISSHFSFRFLFIKFNQAVNVVDTHFSLFVFSSLLSLSRNLWVYVHVMNVVMYINLCVYM